MECLIDYIGVLGCGTSLPLSGLYINQLPGITLKSIDSIANDEQVTWVKVWEDVQQRAARRFNTSVNRLMAKKYKLNTLNKSHCLNSTEYETEIIEDENKWKGFTIKLDEINSNSISAFQTIFIQNVKLYSSTTDSSLIKVYDMNTNEVLFESESKPMTIGWNIININKQFFSNWIFVAYNASTIKSYDLIVSEDASEPCPCIICDTCTVSVSGAESEDIENPTNITSGTNSFGLTGCFNVSCSFNSLVCKNKNIFSNAWMNLLGAELMVERIYSERLNRYTTAGKKEAQELLDYFNTEFEDRLKESVAGILLDDNDCCFVCETGGVQQVNSRM